MVKYIFILALLVGCTQETGVAKQPQPAHIIQYGERKALYETWKESLDNLAAEANIPALKQVSEFLGKGVAIAVPKSGQVFELFGQEGSVLTVLVLFPSDGEVSTELKALYEQAHAGAFFQPENNLLVIRSDKVSPRMQGIMLGHEGFHGLFFASSGRKAKQSDSEYCDEEAIAHRIEIETLMTLSPELAAATKKEAVAIAKKISGSNGKPIELDISIDDHVLEKALGKQESDLDSNYRATLFGHMAYFRALQILHKGNDENAMTHFSDHLCTVYKKYGIR